MLRHAQPGIYPCAQNRQAERLCDIIVSPPFQRGNNIRFQIVCGEHDHGDCVSFFQFREKIKTVSVWQIGVQKNQSVAVSAVLLQFCPGRLQTAAAFRRILFRGKRAYQAVCKGPVIFNNQYVVHEDLFLFFRKYFQNIWKYYT